MKPEPAPEMPEFPKADFPTPPRRIEDWIFELQPGLSWLLFALLSAWLVAMLCRQRDASTSRRWRLLSLGYAALGAWLFAQYIRPLALSENPILSSSLAGLLGASLLAAALSLLASLLSREIQP
ncbi:MAG: hypothetical protein RL095_1586 [Verrucomicrobiota bacterium]|jgi:hypothetical protein